MDGAAAWEAWLERNAGTFAGVWLAIPKRGSAVPGPTYAQALEVALCFGWIDSQKRALDDDVFLQRFTPRRRGSRWSLANRKQVERLLSAGRVRPAGVREVEAARADGRWDAAYPSQSAAVVPPDLAAMLDEHPQAKAHFEALDGRNRYAILFRIAAAKRPATREKRVRAFVAMLERGETIYPSRGGTSRGTRPA